MKTKLSSETEIMLHRLLRQANAWHPITDLQKSLNENPTEKNEAFRTELYNYGVNYNEEHEGMEEYHKVQCAVVEVPSNVRVREVFKQIDSQATIVVKLMRSDSASKQVRDIKRYASSKRIKYQTEDMNNETLLTYEVKKVPIEGDEENCYLLIFMHPEVRALVSAALIQQEQRGMGIAQ